MAIKKGYKIYKVNAFDWLPKRKKSSIHAIVTDPPYGIIEYMPDQILKLKNGNGGVWRLPHNYDGHKRSPKPRFTILGKKDFDRISLFHDQFAKQLIRILVPGGHVFMASQNLLSHLVISSFYKAGFELRGQIARIIKTLRGGDRPKNAHKKYPSVSVTPRACWEPWLIFRKPCEGRIKDNLKKWKTGAIRRPETNKPFIDIIFSCPARGTERKLAPHPSLKPQSYLRQIVFAALPLGKGMILDPFMGGGSTIAAAKYLGLNSIGLEIDPDYFQMAKKAIPKLAKLEINNISKHQIP